MEINDCTLMRCMKSTSNCFAPVGKTGFTQQENMSLVCHPGQTGSWWQVNIPLVLHQDKTGSGWQVNILFVYYPQQSGHMWQGKKLLICHPVKIRTGWQVKYHGMPPREITLQMASKGAIGFRPKRKRVRVSRK